MEPIPSQAMEFVAQVRAALHGSDDLALESLPGGRITLLYLEPLIDPNHLQTNLIEPLNRVCRADCSWNEIYSAVPQRGLLARDTLTAVVRDLLEGRCVVHLSESKSVATFEARRLVRREPKEPRVERTIRGPQISILEVLEDSLLLVRNRIAHPSLRVELLTVGRRTRTRVAVAYLDDVANPGVAREVTNRISGLDIDSLPDSGYLEQMITDNRFSLFPLTQSTERVDKIVTAILEGRVAVLVDGSSNAIVVPVTINELYQSPEDYYFSPWHGSFLRLFRILGNLVALTLPGLYVALMGVNPELLPLRFALAVSGSRMGVAVPLVIELLLMEAVIEIFREGSLLLPTTVSQTLGVTAGVVLGIAAVGAGFVSNATLVVVVVTAIASYSGPNYEIGLTWRVLRFALIGAGALLGLYGLTLAFLTILTHTAAQESFGVSYLAPWAPLDLPGMFDTIPRRPLWFRRRLKTFGQTDMYRSGRKGDGHETE